MPRAHPHASQDATDNLFGIVQRFHDHIDPEVKATHGSVNQQS
jgi:hypothetical protein